MGAAYAGEEVNGRRRVTQQNEEVLLTFATEKIPGRGRCPRPVFMSSGPGLGGELNNNHYFVDVACNSVQARMRCSSGDLKKILRYKVDVSCNSVQARMRRSSGDLKKNLRYNRRGPVARLR